MTLIDSLNNDNRHNLTNKIITYFSDTDNDNNNYMNLYSELTIDSSFYDCETFIQRFKNKKSALFLSLNIQSLNSKYDKLKEFILSLVKKGVTIDIIALQETWTIRYPHLIPIPGFQQIVYKNRFKGTGGGVGFYIREGLNAKIIDRLSPFHDKLFESLTLDITYTTDNQAKHYTVTNIYRSQPPINNMTGQQQFDEFHDKMDSLLNLLSNNNCDAYVFIDSNINLHKINADLQAQSYMTNTTNNGFLLTNFRTTRIQNETFSLIDHILTNCKNKAITSGSITEDISDHLITFLIPDVKKNKTKQQTIKKRLYTKTNLERFKNDLGLLRWNDVTLTNNVDQGYDIFWDHYKTLHDLHFPLVTQKFNKNFHKIADFMTSGLLTSRRNKIRLHKIALTNNNSNSWTTYRTYRNIFNKTLRASKKLYYELKLSENSRNPKKTWDILRELTNSKNSKTMTDKIVVNNATITDETEMANEFNKFFTQAGKNISNSIDPVSKKPCDYIPDKEICLLEFREITEHTVITTIEGMQSKVSMDASGINTKMLKYLKMEIAKPLAHIFSLSVNTGVFPSKLKTSRTIPIYKAGEHTSCDNYRPISLLSAISKILEKIVSCALVEHLEHNNLIYENQFGFLKHRSTVHNILQLTNRVSKDLNSKKFVIGVFLDLRKAFDVVPHNILLDKLRKLGITDRAHSWFTSYLSNRQQYVDINGNTSTSRPLDISVLQGSILGPILFLCFINDLPITTELLALLFADDTAIVDSDTDLRILIGRVNIELQKIANWFRANKMAVNIDKTKYIIFRPKGVKINIDLEENGIVYNDNEIGKENDPIKIRKVGRIHNDHPNSKERTYKFLGIYLDEYLSFDTHCTHICNKLSQSNFIISKAKNFLTASALKTLYYSLIHPHILYGLPIYSGTTQKNLNKIKNMQKKAIRNITKSSYTAHTAPLFTALKILPLNHLITYTKALLIHSIYHKYSPTALHNTWITNNDRNTNFELRNAYDIYVPVARTDQVKRLSYFDLPATWNSLSDNRMTVNQTTFRIELKTHLYNLTSLET